MNPRECHVLFEWPQSGCHETGLITFLFVFPLDGNDDRIFDIARGENNEGILSLTKRLDREFSGLHLLTIKCFRPYERNVKARRGKYDNTVKLTSLL